MSPVGLYSRTLKTLGRKRWFATAMSPVMPHVDRFVHRLGRGRLPVPSQSLAPTLLLTTIGAKSGLERTSPVLYVRDGQDYVVLATNWGKERHPAWSSNLLATPQARIAVGRQTRDVTARRVERAEFDRLFPRFVDIWPAYEAYMERIEAGGGRDVRMFRLS